MLYILMRFATLATEGSPPTKSLTTRRRELAPLAILSGHIDNKPQNPQAVFHRPARPLPGAATETSRKAAKK